MFWRNFSSKITCILRPKLPLKQHEGRAVKNGCRKTVKNWEPEYSLEILRTTHFLSAIFGNESDTILANKLSSGWRQVKQVTGAILSRGAGSSKHHDMEKLRY